MTSESISIAIYVKSVNDSTCVATPYDMSLKNNKCVFFTLTNKTSRISGDSWQNTRICSNCSETL